MRLILDTPSTLRLDFAFDARTKDMVKALPSARFNGEPVAWRLPLLHLRKVLEAFPQAQMDADVAAWLTPFSQTRLDAAKAQCKRLNAVGISVTLCNGRVVYTKLNGDELPAYGKDSPLREYAQEICSLLTDEHTFTVNHYGDTHSSPSSPAMNVQHKLGQKGKLQLVLDGMQNAQKAEERKGYYKKQWYRKAKVKIE